jgi:acetoin utilization deacetylase AcuC-like enzyme
VLPFKLLFHAGLTVDLGAHVFPVQKYRLVRDRLLEAGIADHGDFVTPLPASDQDLLRVHTPEYLRKLRQDDFSTRERMVMEVPWSKDLVQASWLAAGAVIEAASRARRDGCAVVIGGGFHHAFPDHGEGFCLIHDVAVAVRALRAGGSVGRVAILDLDVHQGNGTAAILGADADTFTVSLHQEANYPVSKPRSRIDVGLPDGVGDAEYLAALDGPLAASLDFAPDHLFYLAGADPYEHDLLGGLGLTLAGLRERDRRVFEAARKAGVPVTVTLAGGYAAKTVDTVTIHVNTVLAAAEVFSRTDP